MDSNGDTDRSGDSPTGEDCIKPVKKPVSLESIDDPSVIKDMLKWKSDFLLSKVSELLTHRVEVDTLAGVAKPERSLRPNESQQ